jgi:hypothetical protein
MDSEESIPPAYVAWRAGTKNRVVVLVGHAGNWFLGFLKGLKIRALEAVEDQSIGQSAMPTQNSSRFKITQPLSLKREYIMAMYAPVQYLLPQIYNVDG